MKLSRNPDKTQKAISLHETGFKRPLGLTSAVSIVMRQNLSIDQRKRIQVQEILFCKDLRRNRRDATEARSFDLAVFQKLVI